MLSSHEGEEFIYVMEGRIEINYGKDIFLLDSGDSIYMGSVVEHHVHAADNKPAKILAVLYTPFN
jgi:quercetin dioxygenase-like cupin family protein